MHGKLPLVRQGAAKGRPLSQALTSTCAGHRGGVDGDAVTCLYRRPELGSASEMSALWLRCRSLLVLLVVLLAGSMAVSVVGASAKPAPTVVGDTGEHVLTFNHDNGRGRTAPLNLILKVPAGSAGKLSATFFPTGPRSAGHLTHLNVANQGPYPVDRPRLFTEDGKPPKLDPGLNFVRLTFGLATGASPDAADGLLHLRLAGLTSAKLQTHGQGPEATLAPSPVKIQVTGGFLFFSGSRHESQAVTVSGPGTPAVTRGPEATADLQGSHGADAEATLGFEPTNSLSALGHGAVTASDWSGPGSYSGTVELDPRSADPTSIAVQLDVRDSVVWPILVVLLGAALGGFGTRAYALHRKREILRSALKAAEARYQQSPKPDGLYRLGDDLSGQGEQFPSKKACQEADESRGELARLYCDIHAAKSEAELTEAANRAKAIAARFARWHEFRLGLRRLKRALVDADPPADDPQQVGIASDSQAAIQACRYEPPDAAADAAIAALTSQRELLLAYTRLKRRFQSVPDWERDRLKAYEPAELYRSNRPQGELNATNTWKLLNALGAAHDALRHPEAAPDNPPIPVRIQPRGFMAAGPVEVAETGGDRRSAQQIVTSLRRFDWGIAVATALVTVVVYVVGLYTDTYGGWMNYVAAFGAGAFTQVAIGAAIEQFPLFRSYRLEPATGSK